MYTLGKAYYRVANVDGIYKPILFIPYGLHKENGKVWYYDKIGLLEVSEASVYPTQHSAELRCQTLNKK